MRDAVPQFIPVVPAELALYGGIGAALMGLIRFRCQSAGRDRVDIDGVRHWQASHAELAKQLGGVSRDVVRGGLVKCGPAIAAKHVEPFDDRKKAYHVPPIGEPPTSHVVDSPHRDLPVGESTRGVVKSPGGVVDSPHPVVDSPHVPLSRELEEGGRSGAADVPTAADPADPAAANSEPATPAPTPPGDDPPDEHPGTVGDAAPAAAGPPPNPRHNPGDPPPERCPDHIDHVGWVPKDCRKCGDCGRSRKRWRSDYELWRSDEKDAIDAAMKACGPCGGTGFISRDPYDSWALVDRCQAHRLKSDYPPTAAEREKATP